MNFETETLDKLYLEISQFTTAKTGREIKLEQQRDKLLEASAEFLEMHQKGWWLPDVRDKLQQVIAEVEGK